MSVRLGVDISGTFTDLVALGQDGAVHTKKVSSSVDDYARAILDGLRELGRDAGLPPSAIAEVLHGTTVASNAILELRGARTGLIVHVVGDRALLGPPEAHALVEGVSPVEARIYVPVRNGSRLVTKPIRLPA